MATRSKTVLAALFLVLLCPVICHGGLIHEACDCPSPNPCEHGGCSGEHPCFCTASAVKEPVTRVSVAPSANPVPNMVTTTFCPPKREASILHRREREFHSAVNIRPPCVFPLLI